MGVRYVVDENGNLVSVVLPVEEYKRLLEKLEESEDILAHHKTRAALKRSKEESVPFDQALKETG
ncbi:MAG: hypothetical protein WA990_10895 [Rubrobacteraceae bacterium]